MTEKGLELEPRQKANSTAMSLLFPMDPCLVDKLGDELSDEQLEGLADRISEAVRDEITTTIEEVREDD